MKKWLIFIFLTNAALGLEASAFKSFLKSPEPGLGAAAIELVDFSQNRRRGSSSGLSEGSASTIEGEARSIGEGDAAHELPLMDTEACRRYLDLVFKSRASSVQKKPIARVPPISVAVVSAYVVDIPCFIWQLNKASEKEPCQYYTLEKKGIIRCDFLKENITNGFQLRNYLAHYLELSYKKLGYKKKVESVYFGFPRDSVIIPSDNVIEPSASFFNMPVGTRVAAIAFLYRLSIKEPGEAVIELSEKYGPLNIILRAESNVESLLSSIPLVE